MTEEPEMFIAPCSQKYKDQAYKNFEDTVLNGVPADEYGIDVDTDTGRVPVWGVVSGNEGIWKQLDSGDIVLFYTEESTHTPPACTAQSATRDLEILSGQPTTADDSSEI